MRRIYVSNSDYEYLKEKGLLRTVSIYEIGFWKVPPSGTQGNYLQPRYEKNGGDAKMDTRVTSVNVIEPSIPMPADCHWSNLFDNRPEKKC